MSPATLREWFRFERWAFDQLLDLAAPMTNAQLDQPFEMGPGSLRATLKHMYGASRIWHERVGAPQGESLPNSTPLDALPDLRDASHKLQDARDGWLATMTDADLDREIDYKNMKGEPFTNRLGDILLHVGNHGVHHRAQAINMCRHLGVKTHGMDYIWMRLFEAERPPPVLDVHTIRDYYQYTDWARDRVFEAASPLTDEQLDRPFEIGLGTLRKTLTHLRDAEQFWLTLWQGKAQPPFGSLDPQITLPDLAALYHDTAEQRDVILAGIDAAGLAQTVTVTPPSRPPVTIPIGETMLQLNGHGTHHRAQALNMLRHLGGNVSMLDYIAYKRIESA